MAKGWEPYSVVLLSAAIALFVPGALLLSSRPGRKDRGLAEPRHFSAGTRRVNTRFFLGINAAVVLLTLVLGVLPCIGVFRPPGPGGASAMSDLRLRGAFAVCSICFIAGIALLYAARKGDLNWLRSYREGGE